MQRKTGEMKLYLQSEQIVNSADDDVDRSCAACLCAQIVLEIWRKMVMQNQLFF